MKNIEWASQILSGLAVGSPTDPPDVLPYLGNAEQLQFAQTLLLQSIAESLELLVTPTVQEEHERNLPNNRSE